MKKKICYIKRITRDKENNVLRQMYFAKHLGLNINQNHWVLDMREAKKYFDGRTAQGVIKKYKLKDCIVEYVELI